MILENSLKHQAILILVLASTVIVPSCEKDRLPTEPLGGLVGTAIGSIEYIVSGGFAGGIHTNLTIDATGKVMLLSASPPIAGMLTTHERSSLSTLACTIWTQPDTVFGGCMDDFRFNIRWMDARGTKTIAADGCAMSPVSGSVPYPVINEMIDLLGSIAARVFQEGASWRGMQASFAIDDSSYALDRSITLTYTLSNPSSVVRTLQFAHASQFRFSVDKNNFPGFHYTYPLSVADPSGHPDSSSPSVIVLTPGEQKSLIYTWDRSTVDPQGVEAKLGVGTYVMQTALLAGDFTPRYFRFEVYDSSIPIKGDIIPDWSNADAGSDRYIVQLKVMNWSAQSVTLHFANDQHVAVELWDLDFNPPRTMVYSTPLKPGGNQQIRTLAPHENVIFADTVEKSAIKAGYFWSLAKVRLLCTDFDFRREGQLQIFH